jgi:hypothetical protein
MHDQLQTVLYRVLALFAHAMVYSKVILACGSMVLLSLVGSFFAPQGEKEPTKVKIPGDPRLRSSAFIRVQCLGATVAWLEMV